LWRTVLSDRSPWSLSPDGELGAAVSLIVENGRVTRISVMRNPRKLARLDETAELAR
jgi:leucyl aminopeptidase (aminopeptidase T)